MKGSKVVWPVCDLQREWVGTKVIGESQRGNARFAPVVAKGGMGSDQRLLVNVLRRGSKPNDQS